MKRKKLCFICSSGGHFSELSKLFSISNRYDSFLITEKTSKLDCLAFKKIFFVKIINRKEAFFIVNFIFLALKELLIFIKEQPDFIISTGALCSYPMFIYAKIFKKKTIYVESIARIEDLSLTGKKLYRKTDLFFVQWPELQMKYPNSIYLGNLFGDY